MRNLFKVHIKDTRTTLASDVFIVNFTQALLILQMFTWLKLSKLMLAKLGAVSVKLNVDLTHPLSILDEEKKIDLNFYFHTSSWYIRRFYKVLKGFYKTL